MAMLISKFHRLIQSRLLWGTFLVIIVISFVGWGVKWPGCSAQPTGGEGLLDGKPVPPEEFQQAYNNSRLGFALMTGRSVVATPAVAKDLRQATWRRIAMLRQAHGLGLIASDIEVMAAIQQQPMFQADGRFNAAQYDAFVQSVLGNLGVTEPFFEEYLREELVLQKLRGAVSQTLLVPPSDLQRALSAVGDQFILEYAVVTPASVTGAVQVAAADPRAYFASHTNDFVVPEKVIVQVVEFPASNYLAQVRVAEQEVTDYYNEHMDHYSRVVETNAPALGTNPPARVSQTVTQPFDEVKSNIVEQLRLAAARAQAADAAAEFVTSLVKDRKGQALTFTQAAAKGKLAIRKVGPFAQDEPVPGIDAGRAFQQAAFSRREAVDDERFSDPIPGRAGSYVLQIEQRLSARVPAFEEVAARATDAARAAAVRAALEQKARSVRAAALQAAVGGAAWAQALQPLGLTAQTVTGAFVSVGASTNAYLETMLQGAVMYNAGEVSDLISADDGSLLVARVAQRQPCDAATLSTLAPEITANLVRQRSRALLAAYEDYLLQQAHFRDRHASAAGAAEEGAASDLPEEATPSRRPLLPADAL
ncbi:MAG: peptidylprolyl isomerase [Kiritimatiellaeota bacterium]|nr:peptidylprolyl isomerase [Kiritimatiellota bacterium]